VDTQKAIEAVDGLIRIVGDSLGLQVGREALVQVGRAEARLVAVSEEARAAVRRLSEARAEEQEIQRRVAAQDSARVEAEREHVEKTTWRSAETKLAEQRLARVRAGLEELQGHAYVSDPKAAKHKWDLDSFVTSEAPKLAAEMAAKDPARDPQSREDEAREKTRQKWLGIAAFCIETVAEWQEAKAITAQRNADALASNAAAVQTTAGRR